MLVIGNCYFVRTATDYYVGRLVEMDGPLVGVLDEWSWVAQTGRLSEFLRNGLANGMEIEPAPTGMLNRIPVMGSVWIDWPHALLREVV